ncbi:MAG: hypothetical protein IPL61_30800 [Myxococcales bacterium]|nr:hypothetical protein [Myxococcales bacterium]
MARLALAVLAAIAVPATAWAERPASVALGIGASVDSTPLGVRAVSAPIAIDVGASLAAPLWWHAGATFGSGALADELGDGHTVAVRTGPRLERCWDGDLCVGVGVEAGWSHARWALAAADATVTTDAIEATAQLHAAIAIDARRKVFLAAAAGPSVRYALAIDDAAGLVMGDRVDAGLAIGVRLVVRN